MIYLILIVFIATLSLFSSAKRDYGLVGYLIVIILALFAGLRFEVGSKPDWDVYYTVFYDAPERFSQLLLYFSDNDRLEKGYLLYNFIIHSIVDDFNFFLVCTALLTIGLTYKSISYYTPMTIFALLIYMRYGYFQFNMMFLRQGIAVAIFLFSIRYIQTRKAFKYLFLNVLGVTFHISLIVVLPLYYFVHRIYSKRTLLVILSLAIVFEYIGGIRLLADKLPSSNILFYAFKSYVGRDEIKAFSFSFIEKPLIFFLLLYYRDVLIERFKYFNVLFNLSFIGLVLSIVFYQFEDLNDRFVIIFNIANIILLTHVASLFSRENKVLYIFIISVVVIYFVFQITNVEQYTPYNILGRIYF